MLFRFSAAEICDITVKKKKTKDTYMPQILSAMSEKSGDAADWYFGMNPNKVSEADTGRDGGIKPKTQKLVSSHTQKGKKKKKKKVCPVIACLQ